MLGINDKFFNPKELGKISKEDRDLMQASEYIDTFNRLFELVMKHLKIEGIEDDERLIACDEQILLYIWAVCGQFCLEEVEPERYMFKPSYAGPFFTPNLYPTSAFVWNLNGGETRELNCYIPGADVKVSTVTQSGRKISLRKYQCVYGKCNFIKRPIFYSLWSTAKRLTDIQNTLDVIALSTKKPIMLVGPEEEMKSLKTSFQKIRDNDPLIVQYKTIGGNTSIESFDMGYKTGTLKEIEEYYLYVENQFLLHNGIDINPLQDKKERVLTSEVETSDNQSDEYWNILTYGLNRFLEDCNDAYNLHLRLVRRYDDGENTETQDIQSVEDGQSNILQ